MRDTSEQFNNMPLISVIVPVYKTESYLCKCMDSVMCQTYPALEVLLIDDGSPDGCPAICDDYAEKDRRIKVIHKQNGGVSSARNAGLDVATGDYIGFVDSDDWIEPDMFERLLRLAQNTDADLSVCGVFRDMENGADDKKQLTDSPEVVSALEARIAIHRGEKMEGHVWNKLFRTELFRNVRFTEGITFCEDLMVCGQVFANCETVAFTPRKYYHYLLRDSSALHTFHETDFSVYRACLFLYQQMQQISPENLYYADYSYLYLSIGLIAHCCLSNALSDENFTRIQFEVKQHINKRAFALLKPKEKGTILAICTGKGAYLLTRKAKRFFHG